MPRKKVTPTSPVVQETKNVLKDELRTRMMIETYGENYSDREETIAKLLHDRLDFFQGLDLSIIVPESHNIINKYAKYIMDFHVAIPTAKITSTINDLGNSLGGISTEKQLQIALDRIKGTLANKYVNKKTPEGVDRDKLIGILRAKHAPNMRSGEYKRLNKNIVVLLDKCLSIIQEDKKFSIDQFKPYLREIPKDMLVNELQRFIKENTK